MTEKEAAPMVKRGLAFLASIPARKAATEAASHANNGEARRNGAAKRKALRSARANPRTAPAPVA